MNKAYLNLLLSVILLFFSAWGHAQSLYKTNDRLSPVKSVKEVKASKAEIVVIEPEYRLLGLQATVGENGAELAWTSSAHIEAFRQDDGTMVDGIGLNGAGPTSVVGVAFPDMRKLERILWAHYNVSGVEPAERIIDLFVFDLDEDGKPVNTILYAARQLECIPPVIVHDLCTPLETPHGCFVAFAAADGELLSLGMDDGAGGDYPFVRKINYFSTDYTTGNFIGGDAQGLTQNLFVRTYGVGKGVAESSAGEVAAPKAETYDVWRFKMGEEAEPARWIKLNGTPLTEALYTDAAYGSQPMGVYRYAVDANGVSPALPSVSCVVYKDMHTTVEATVETVVSGFVPKTVTATLTGENDLLGAQTYSCTVKADGKIRFENIFKGNYTLTVVSPGFETIKKEVDLTADNTYNIGTVRLKEHLDAPWSLAVEKMSVPGGRTISWNPLYAFEEGVEEHPDFAIHSPGELGWSYIDGDGGKPYGINNCTFPNMGQPMAFMAFNPSLTSPALSNLSPAIAHGGRKYFVAISNMPAAGGPIPNNDWIISPELDFEHNIIFEFWAKSYQTDYLESIRVWYSTGGKSQSDFTHALTPETVVVPDVWTPYRYTLPSEAKYVAIQYVSEDAFIFMLDDLRISEQRSQGLPQAFEILLDGDVYDTVTTLKVDIPDLTTGTHKIGVKALYQTGVSAVTEQTFEVSDKIAGLKAVLKDISGDPVVAATVTVKGEFSYTGTSDAEGAVLMGNMQGGMEYALEIAADGYKNYEQTVALADDTLQLGQIVLVDRPAKPGTVYAAETVDRQAVKLSWRSPTDYRLFRKDDGTIQGGLGQNAGTDKTVVGAVYFDAAELYSISWMTATQGENTINLFVFDVDYAGMPVKRVLYEARNVLNIGMTWNTHYLERPLRCPNGFMLAVSGTTTGNVGLGADSGKDSIWPFIPKTNYLIQDYTDNTEQFRLLDQQFARNMMLRAEGSVGVADKFETQGKAASGYKVYRSLTGVGVNENYVCIGDQQTAVTFTDGDWAELPRGYYRYGVRSFYPNGDSSEMALSNVIGKQMETTVEVCVLADGQPATGTSVRLEGASEEAVEATTDDAGVARFTRLATGIYDLRIQKEGYAEFAVYGMDFSSEPTYAVGPYALQEKLPSPTGLTVEETSDPTSRILRWDEIPTEETPDAFQAGRPDFYLLGVDRKAAFYLYEVSLDGQRLGETAETAYRIGKLAKGKHTVAVRVKDGFSYSEPAEATFKVETVSNGNLSGASLQVYPNPVREGVFSVSLPTADSRLELTDMQGRRVVYTENGSGRIRQLRLGANVKGLLLLRVEMADGASTEKITVL